MFYFYFLPHFLTPLSVNIIKYLSFTMQIWDLRLNKKDAVTFFQENGVLLKRQLCGPGQKAKLYFGK